TRSASPFWDRSAISTRSPICGSPRSTGVSSRWTTSRGRSRHCARAVPRGSPPPPARHVSGGNRREDSSPRRDDTAAGRGCDEQGPVAWPEEGEGMTETVSGSTTRRGKGGRKGLKIERIFTTPGVHPYDELRWERRDVVMTNWRDG